MWSVMSADGESQVNRQTERLMDGSLFLFVCRSPQEEAQLQMEPIVKENVEMPEAQTNVETRDMLRYFIQHLPFKHIPKSSEHKQPSKNHFPGSRFSGCILILL